MEKDRREQWEIEREQVIQKSDQEKKDFEEFVRSIEKKPKEDLLSLRSQLEKDWDSNLGNPEKGALNPIRDRLTALNKRLLELGVED